MQLRSDTLNKSRSEQQTTWGLLCDSHESNHLNLNSVYPYELSTPPLGRTSQSLVTWKLTPPGVWLLVKRGSSSRNLCSSFMSGSELDLIQVWARMRQSGVSSVPLDIHGTRHSRSEVEIDCKLWLKLRISQRERWPSPSLVAHNEEEEACSPGCFMGCKPRLLKSLTRLRCYTVFRIRRRWFHSR